MGLALLELVGQGLSRLETVAANGSRPQLHENNNSALRAKV